jgi:hypothetical protein
MIQAGPWQHCSMPSGGVREEVFAIHGVPGMQEKCHAA